MGAPATPPPLEIVAAAPAGDAVEILKPPQDKRLYRRIKLSNGMNVLLISDPEMGNSLTEENPDENDMDGEAADSGSDEEEMGSGSEGEESGSGSEEEDDGAPGPRGEDKPVKKAAAAMVVGIGSLSDPKNMQGLSHYLEHMLFMGSAKFPDENDYDSFLSKSGGGSNAYTELEYTNYQFDCKPAALHGALERFAQFFIAPLCKEDALEREVMAVNNEFTGVLQSDECRLNQLRCHTSYAGHIFNQFSWGNRKSLYDGPRAAGIPIRDEIVKYYGQHYSAERMSLVILGGEDLDTLAGWTGDFFTDVPSGMGPSPDFSAAGLPFQGERLHIMPAVKDQHRICITFQLPSLHSQYYKKADEYLSHLIGHEGAGSLLSSLKARGWATSLSAGVTDGGYERNSVVYLFDVSITLTEAGLAAGPGFGMASVGVVFEFIKMLEQLGPQQWAFDELKSIAEMKFRFAEEEDACEYVTHLAADMPLYEPAHVLKGSYLYGQWDAELIQKLLCSMTPRAARLDVQTRAYDTLTAQINKLPDAKSDIEPWFELPYVAASVPEELLADWESRVPSPELTLPPRNTYLPADFSLRGGTAEGAAQAVDGGVEDAADTVASPPELISQAPGLRLWHNLDHTFQVPRANAYFLLTSAATYDSPRSAALTHLTLKLLEDALCETAYLADVAGLHYDVVAEGLAGIDIKVDGFSDKLPALTKTLFQSLASFQVDAKRFDRVLEDLVRKYRNANMRPEQAASYVRLQTLRHTAWHFDAVLPFLEALQPADIQNFIPILLAEVHVEALLHGNITRTEAEAVAASVLAALPGATMAASARPQDRCVALQPGVVYLHRSPVKNAEEANSVMELYLQCLPDTVEARARVDMVDQMIGEPCYDTLRTKQQLGYSVHSGVRLTFGVIGFCVVIASGTHGPAELEQRIESFLQSFAADLAAMAPEDFERHRSSLIASKLQKDHSLGEQGDRYWEQIFNQRYDFHDRQREVAVLRTLTQADVLAFYHAHFVPEIAKRRKLAVHVAGKSRLAELTEVPVGAQVQLVTDVDALKAGLPLHPAPTGEPIAVSGKK